jgi:hypothetical protein
VSVQRIHLRHPQHAAQFRNGPRKAAIYAYGADWAVLSASPNAQRLLCAAQVSGGLASGQCSAGFLRQWGKQLVCHR